MTSGRYGSASEVIRDALRNMEERRSKLDALGEHLSESAVQAAKGEFIDDYSIECVLSELDQEG